MKERNNINLKRIPDALSIRLTEAYERINSRYRALDFEHHETSVGKFCEVILRIFQNELGMEVTPINEGIRESKQIIKAIQKKEELDVSIRKRIAPLVEILLSFRNERDAAHVGDIDLGHIDTNFTFYATRWIYAELLRVYGGLDKEKLQVEVNRTAEIIWPDLVDIEGEKVVVNPKLTSKETIVTLLKDGNKGFDEIFELNAKEQNKSRLKKTLKTLERNKIIYFQKEKKYYVIMPGVTIESLKDKKAPRRKRLIKKQHE